MSANNWTHCPKCNEYELREDYDIGIYDGIFFIDYRAVCIECGFKYTYVAERKSVI